jgi:hypothetical protein
MASTVIEVALKDLDEAEADRVEQLVETLANDIIPSLSEAAGVSGTDLAARLMAELGYIVGFTSHPADALDVLVAAGQAVRTGIGEAEALSSAESTEGVEEAEAEAPKANRSKSGGSLH